MKNKKKKKARIKKEIKTKSKKTKGKPAKKIQIEKYKNLSPFELKNILLTLAKESCAKSENKKARVLNAGRGNPNFLNTTVREAFSYLNLFANELAKKGSGTADLGFRPSKEGIAQKLKEYLRNQKGSLAVNFLKNAVEFAEKEVGLDPNEFSGELTNACLGDIYPYPPRILPNTEKIVTAYLKEALCPEGPGAKGKFDLFACEGATAAMVYVFNSLKHNKILKAGDRIAVITPIFSPYLEMAALKDYQLTAVRIEQGEDLGWQVPDTELEKLKDKKVKALLMVDPANPTSVKLKKETLHKIAKLIQTQKKDLIVIIDAVYATFVNDFHSLIEVAAENTIGIYSYSKFFGAAGWRLGVIMLHENNVIDKMIAAPKFIDRLEIDSRNAALAHNGGLSGPQQCMLCLFSLFYLIDKRRLYKKSIHSMLTKRITCLYDNLDLGVYTGPDHTYYYTLLNLERMARIKHGDDFADYFRDKLSLLEFIFRLAQEKFTVCLPGEGFAGPKWSIRISLANLDDEAYKLIGKNISAIMNDHYKKWAEKHQKKTKTKR